MIGSIIRLLIHKPWKQKMNMYHIELTKPNGSNIKTNFPARDVVELQKIVDKQYAGYKLKVKEVTK